MQAGDGLRQLLAAGRTGYDLRFELVTALAACSQADLTGEYGRRTRGVPRAYVVPCAS